MKRFIYTKVILMAALVFGGKAVDAQCKTYLIGAKGDTLNCTDAKGLKQGIWIEKTPELRGNPGFDEEGMYKDGRKEGTWRRFSLQGDIEYVQQYRWGLLSGKSVFYNLMGIEREENWYAINPDKQYDTIDVPDLYDMNKTNAVVVKNEGRSIKHGAWKFFDPQTGRVQRTENYFKDSLVDGLAAFGVTNKFARPARDTTKPKSEIKKPSAVLEWEKKNAGKKKVKYQDGSTGM